MGGKLKMLSLLFEDDEFYYFTNSAELKRVKKMVEDLSLCRMKILEPRTLEILKEERFFYFQNFYFEKREKG